jgi:hypothetical protein
LDFNLDIDNIKMKTIVKIGLVLGMFIFLPVLTSYTQVSISNDTILPDSSSMLDIISTHKGLLIPRMTFNQRDSIVKPACGLLVYNIEDNQFYYNQGSPAVPKWALLNSRLSNSYPLDSSLNLVNFVGNSLTSSIDGSYKYPHRCITNLGGTQRVTPGYYGTNGITTATLITNFNNGGIPNTVINFPMAINVFVVWEGTNDLCADTSRVNAYNRILQLCQLAKYAGFKVVVASILPRSYPGTPPSYESARQYVNNQIRLNYQHFADDIADVGGDALMGNSGDEANTTYYLDLLHLTTSGYNRIADLYFTPAIFRQLIKSNDAWKISDNTLYYLGNVSIGRNSAQGKFQIHDGSANIGFGKIITTWGGINFSDAPVSLNHYALGANGDGQTRVNSPSGYVSLTAGNVEKVNVYPDSTVMIEIVKLKSVPTLGNTPVFGLTIDQNNTVNKYPWPTPGDTTWTDNGYSVNKQTSKRDTVSMKIAKVTSGVIAPNLTLSESDTLVAVKGKSVFISADSSYYDCRSTTSAHKWWKRKYE